MVATEEAWLPAARTGDADAVEALIRSLRPRVLRYCLARLGNYAAAEDVTQEVCLAVVTALPRYRDEGHPFSAFVFAVAANKLREAGRAAARRRDDPSESLPDRADTAAGPEEAAALLDEVRQVRNLLATLPEMHQEVLLLRVAAGLSVAETARSLRVSPASVRVTQHRALARLRRQVTP